MHSSRWSLPIALGLFAFGCSGDADTQSSDVSDLKDALGTTAGASDSGLSGEVVETMDSGGYTYARIRTEQGVVWSAGPAQEMSVGDEVIIRTDLAVADFYSATLDRTFELLYFTDSFDGSNPSAQSASFPPGHPTMGGHGAGGAPMSAPVDYSGIRKPQGGHTVEEVWTSRSELEAKDVLVRGRVVKFLAGIMGKNWLHLRDGTGDEGADDLTVTTSDLAKVGDTVLARGRIVVNKDLGAGYHYAVLMEDAKITVE